MAGNIKGITIEIDGNTQKLSKALESVNKDLKLTQSSLKDVNKLLKFDPKNVTLLQQKQQLLNRAISDTKQKIEQEKTVLSQMDASGVDRTSERYQALEREIIDNEQALRRLNAEMLQFGTVSGARMIALGQQLKTVGSGIASVGRSFTTYLTVPIAGFGAAATKNFASVDKQFRLVKSTMGDVKNSAQDFEDLWNEMSEAASDSVYSMQDSADALLNFARQGFTAKEAADMLEPALNLAAATGTDLSEVTSGLGNSMKAFGADSSEAADYADIFAKAQAQANTSTTDLFEAMSIAGPIFKTVGWDIKDLATLTGIFGDAGISGSEGANALKTGLANLAEKASATKGPMKELGLAMGGANSIFDESTGQMKSMPEVVENLQNAFSGLTDQEKLEAAASIFGKNQMSKWMVLIDDSPEHVEGLRSSLEDLEGTSESMADALLSGVGGSLEKLKSTFDVFSVNLGKALAPTVQAIAEKITEVLTWFNQLSPEIQETIAKVLLFVAAIGPVLLIVGKAISLGGSLLMTIGTIKNAIAGVSTAIGGIKGVISALTNPIGLIIAAIAALVAGFVILFNTNDEFREAVIDVWENQILPAIQTVVETIQQLWEEVLKPAFEAIVDFCVNTLAPAIVDIWEGIILPALEAAFTVISELWENVLKPIFEGLAQILMEVLIPAFETAWNGIILPLIETVWTAIQVLWESVLKPVFEIIGQFVLEVLWPAIQTAFEAIGKIIQVVFDGIVAIWHGVLEPVFKAIGDFCSNILFPVIQVVFKAIGEVVQTAFELIKGVWEHILQPVFESIGEFLTGVIQPIFETVWDAVKSVVETVFNAIKGFWDDTLKPVFEAVKKFLEEKVQPVFETVWEAVKKVVDDVFGAIKGFWDDTLKPVFDAIGKVLKDVKKAWDDVFGAIKKTTGDVFDWIWDKVSGVVEDLKGVFNFEWSLPDIQLPEFYIDGEFSLNPPSVPYIGIKWHKDAYDDPLLFTRPTVMATSSGFHGFGDGAGSELVIGTNKLLNIIRDATAQEPTNVVNGGINFTIYAQPGQSAKEIAQEVNDILQDQMTRSREVWA